MRLAAVAFAVLLLAGATVASPLVEVATEEGAIRLTVRARNAVSVDLLREIARRSGRVLLMAEDMPDGDVLTTVDLRHRALDEVVEILAGSAGLVATIRPDSISLASESVVPDGRDLRLRALAAHARSILAHPDHADVVVTRIAMAEIHLRLGEVESALDDLNRAVAGLKEIATEENGEQQLARARRIARLFVEAHARLEHWQAVVERGQALARDGQAGPPLLLHLGRAYAALGQVGMARGHLERVSREGTPERAARARLALAQIEDPDERPDEVRAHLRAAAASDHPAVGGAALLRLADLATASGRHAEAAAHLKAFTRRFPDDARAAPTALRLVDLVAGPLGEPFDAAAILEKVLERYPDCLGEVEAAIRLAHLWAEVGAVDRAAAKLGTAIGTRAEDDPDRDLLLEALATILEEGLLPAKARIAWRRLAVLPGRSAHGRLRAARCLLRIADDAPTASEQRRELLSALEEVRAVGRDDLSDEDAALRLEIEVACLQQLGDAEGARRALEEAMR